MYSSHALRERLPSLLDPKPDLPRGVDGTPAAVLVPILASAADPRLVFTKRTDSLSRHAGEISFPGGLVDPGEPLRDAALREAEEELGLASSEVELLGSLSPVHTHVSGILIVPFVGMLWQDPLFTPNAAEIAEVLEFPLADLVAAATEQEFHHEGRAFQTFVYDMNGHVIWGATARILSSFIDVLETAAS